MSDRLFQHRTELPLDAVHPGSAVEEIAKVVESLEEQAETRPFPVALDWAGLVITIGSLDDKFRVVASAPVL